MLWKIAVSRSGNQRLPSSGLLGSGNPFLSESQLRTGASLAWRLLCSSVLGGKVQPLTRKQVITKKELHCSLQGLLCPSEALLRCCSAPSECQERYFFFMYIELELFCVQEQPPTALPKLKYKFPYVCLYIQI